MLRKPIKYVNFLGEEKTVDAYFNFTRKELTDMAMKSISIDGTKIGDGTPFEIYLNKRIDEAKNLYELFDFVKEFVLLAYGEISEDGERFVKNDEIRNKFESSAAFDSFWNELIETTTNQEELGEFFNEFLKGCLPKENYEIWHETNANLLAAESNEEVAEKVETKPKKRTSTKKASSKTNKMN